MSSLFGGEDAEAAGDLGLTLSTGGCQIRKEKRRGKGDKQTGRALACGSEVFQQMGGEELVNAKLKRTTPYKILRVAGRVNWNSSMIS